MRWARLVVLAMVLVAGCATSPRYQRVKIQVSFLCTVTLIRDLRTEACFLAYHCGILRGGVSVVQTEPEVCEP